jgi:hypothetical protein
VDSVNFVGAFAFGVVVGWVTYRTLRRTTPGGLTDIGSVIGAVGGAAVTALFPKETAVFGYYCIGLAVGFFGYLLLAIILAKMEKDPQKVSTWLGEHPWVAVPRAAGGGGGIPHVLDDHG